MVKFQCFPNVLYPNIRDLYIKGTKNVTKGNAGQSMVFPKFIGRISVVPSSSEKGRFQCSLLTQNFMLSSLPDSSISVESVDDYIKHLEQMNTSTNDTLEFLLHRQDYLQFKGLHVIAKRKAPSDGSVPEKMYVDFISGRPHLCHIISNSSRISRSDFQKLVSSGREYLVEFLNRHISIFDFKVIDTITGEEQVKLTDLIAEIME